MALKKFVTSLIAAGYLVLTPSVSFANSHDGAGYQLYVTSSCPVKMRLAVRYLSPGYNWQSRHWWTLEPNSGTYLSSDGSRILHQAGLKYLYVYAETISGRGYFNEEARPADYNLIKTRENRYYVGRRAEGKINGDTFEFTLHCNDS